LFCPDAGRKTGLFIKLLALIQGKPEHPINKSEQPTATSDPHSTNQQAIDLDNTKTYDKKKQQGKDEC
jgi:hypothetical protein